MELNLSPEIVRLIEAKLAGGSFRTAEEVVEQAVLLLDQVGVPPLDEDEEWLREAIAEAKASGEPVEIDLENLKDYLINGAPLKIR